jgi:hypothetical protein
MAQRMNNMEEGGGAMSGAKPGAKGPASSTLIVDESPRHDH